MNGPAPYCNSDSIEIDSITILRSLIDSSKIKTDIRERDKIPNIDGHIQLVNESQRPYASFEIQVKTIPKNLREKCKFDCETSLFSYAQNSTSSPVLLIGVDPQNNRAFWIQISPELFQKFSGKIKKQQTVRLQFPAENSISRNNDYLIKSLEKIFSNSIDRIKKYKDIENRLFLLNERSNSLIGTTKPEIVEIHKFLDYLNHFLENEFAIVKSVYYESSWKLGFAIHQYENNRVGFYIYSIPEDKNDVQIKEIDESTLRQIRTTQPRYRYQYVHTSNPVKTSPKKTALEIIQIDMENIFQYRLLNNKHLFLANEFIIAFIDGFYEQMAIEIKENYTIDEIERGFNHLLFWSNESLESLAMRNGINRSDLLKEIPYIDPNEIWRLLSTVEILSINQTVSEKIKMGVILPQIVVGNEKLPFGLFQELFSYIKSKNYNTVSRTFKPLDYAKKTHYTCIPYDGYDESIFKSNLKTLFKNLPDIYLTLVNQNFPKIANKIKLFGGANKILVIFDFKEDYKSMESPWVYILYYFDSELNKIQTEFYEKSEFCKVTDYDLECLKTSITINGKNFKNVGVQYQEVGFILKNLPVMNYVYKEIEGNLNNYIQRISNK